MDLWVLRSLVDSALPGSGALSAAIVDGADVPVADRQRLATRLGLPEVVFVDDASSHAVRVFTPKRERPFAGYPLMATAWLLDDVGHSNGIMHVPAGRVTVRRSAPAEVTMHYPVAWQVYRTYEEFASVEELEELPSWTDATVRWAWESRAAGTVRARFTIPDHPPAEGVSVGIAATLAVEVGLPLILRLGNNALCFAAPRSDGTVEVRGTVLLERVESISGHAVSTP